MNNYKVMIYKSDNGLWCARKQYEYGMSVAYMFGWSSESLKYKLVEDGEEEDNIFICDEIIIESE